jgi:hypothetical protein
MCRVLLQCVSYEEEDTCDNVSCGYNLCHMRRRIHMTMCRVLLQCVSYEEEDTCDNVSCVITMCVI